MDKPLLKKYELKESGLIYVFCEQTIAYVNTPDDDPEFITGVPADIVKELLSKPGKVVSYKKLYKACYGDTDPTSKYINHIQQQVAKLPESLRQEKIKNYRIKKQSMETNVQDEDENEDEDNVTIKKYVPGYSLGVKRVTPIYRVLENPTEALPSKFYHLAGEYVALYPNPQKNNKLLGAFIQICKHEDVLAVNAIFDIPSNKALERVLKLCPGSSDYSEIITMLHSEIPALNMKSWFTGVLKNEEQHIATLVLKSVLANDKRNIVLDISNFLKNPDRELIDERDQYRGGLGLVIGGGQTDYGFTAHRIGLIRTSWYKTSSMGLDSKELLYRLKATNFVNINSNLDSEFYLWILLKDKEP